MSNLDTLTTPTDLTRASAFGSKRSGADIEWKTAHNVLELLQGDPTVKSLEVVRGWLAVWDKRPKEADMERLRHMIHKLFEVRLNDYLDRDPTNGQLIALSARYTAKNSPLVDIDFKPTLNLDDRLPFNE